MDKDYHATDDDLPDIFRVPSDGNSGCPNPDNESSIARVAAVQLHYPEIRLKKDQRRADRIMRRHEREGIQLQDRKQYIKLGKKLQMFDWLSVLEISFPIMRDIERNFCEQLLAKFRQYTPYAVKWVTRKQYDWLLQISAQYLPVPKP